MDNDKGINSEDIQSCADIVRAFAQSHPKSTRTDCAELFAILLSECAIVKSGKVRHITYNNLEIFNG